MKKLISLILALVMVFAICALAGCGGSDDEKTLVMATNAAFPPYEYYEGGKIVGIDAEIAAEIAKKLDMKLEIKDIEFDSIVAGVSSGKYDMGMAGMTVTEDRLKSVNFTTSYAKGIQSVIVLENSEYASFEDFYTGFDAEENPVGVKDGIKIGVQMGTTGDIYASDDPENWGFGKDKVAQYNTGADAVQALLTGKVTAVIIDNEPAKAYVAANKGLKILEGSYAEEDYAICLAKNNTELLNKINKALDELIKDGTVKKIVDKYIKAD
ncbi:MAG: transporter substrate-binding domain-containing protein [Clostridia bacterium]|nr:transporter substrate-binding domain-containing protein [Clostridia bacterium]